jgi:hypothetical protein
LSDKKFKKLKNEFGIEVHIINDYKFNLLNAIIIAFLFFGFYMIALFIYNSIVDYKYLNIAIIFTLFGLYGLWGLFIQLKSIVLLHFADEYVSIKYNKIQFKQSFFIFYLNKTYTFNEIKEIKINVLQDDKYSKASNMFIKVVYGTITFTKTRKKGFSIGKSLEKENLETLYSEIQKVLEEFNFYSNTKYTNQIKLH